VSTGRRKQLIRIYRLTKRSRWWDWRDWFCWLSVKNEKVSELFFVCDMFSVYTMAGKTHTVAIIYLNVSRQIGRE